MSSPLTDGTSWLNFSLSKVFFSVLARLGYNSSRLIILLALSHFSQKGLKNIRMLHCFLTKSFPNVNCHAYKLEKKSLAKSLVSICYRVSNMGEAINMLSFNVNFLFQT